MDPTNILELFWIQKTVLHWKCLNVTDLEQPLHTLLHTKSSSTLPWLFVVFSPIFHVPIVAYHSF